MDYPFISYGTYRLKEVDINIGLETALKFGYRSIDTALLYNNQKYIGNYIKRNEIPRHEIWITSKLSPKIIPKSEDEIRKSIITTLEELNTDYLDLYLIHAPNKSNIEKCWSILEEFKKRGILRNIGVSNFKIDDLQQLKSFSTEEIFTNQIELSPFLTREELVSFMKINKIPISAHSSLTKGEKLSYPLLLELSNKYNKTPAQLLLKWSLSNDYRIIPRSKNPLHIEENIKLDFVINQDDINKLNELNCDYYTHPQYK